MKLLGCNQQNIYSKDIIVCGVPIIGRLRKVGEADPLITSKNDILYFDYLTIEEEEAYGANS